MSSGKSEHSGDKADPLLSEWESCIKELAYFRLAYLVENTVELQRQYSSPAELPCLKQLAIEELWHVIDQALSLPPDFERNVKRAIESRIKSSKRSIVEERRAIKELRSIQDGVQWPNEDLERREAQEIFGKALQGLSHEQARTLALLHGLGGGETLKVAEVAAREDVSVQTIRNRKRKAYRQLRQNEAIRSLVS